MRCRLFLGFFCFILSVSCVSAQGLTPDKHLVVSFYPQTDEERAKEIVLELFDLDSEEAIERLYKDDRPVEEIIEKFPRRSARMPKQKTVTLPLVYKVQYQFTGALVEQLKEEAQQYEEIQFLDRDINIRLYEDETQ